MKSCCIDTNVLLMGYDFSEYDKIYCPIKVLEELDNLKFSSNPKKAYYARVALRTLKDELLHKTEYVVTFDGEDNFTLPVELDCNKSDNNILYYVKKIQNLYDESACLISYDVNMIEKAKALNIFCKHLYTNETPYVYKGYKEVTLNDFEIAVFYENLSFNKFDCIQNEYVIVNNTKGETIDKLKWDGRAYRPIKFKQINNQYVGKIKPRNKYQELAMDLLQDDSITVKILSGRWGSGKDYLMASQAINYILNGKYSKIIWLRNNIEVKDSRQIGFLPGTTTDKILPYAMPLADHLGGVDGLNLLITQGKIELQHLGFIRGRDIKDSIIICSEAENMTKSHLQLIISRMGENTSLWINGDYKQIDDIAFENDNGLIKSINMLKGNKLFGHVTLEITERSESAEMASLLDE